MSKMKAKQSGFVLFRGLEEFVVSVFPNAVRVSFDLHLLVFPLSQKGIC